MRQIACARGRRLVALVVTGAAQAPKTDPPPCRPTRRTSRPSSSRTARRCHRPGEIGADVAADVRRRAAVGEGDRDKSARGRCRRGTRTARHGTFLNERSLTTPRKTTLISWASGGAPQGRSERHAPAPEIRRWLVDRQARRRLRNAGGLQGPRRRRRRVPVLLHPDELHGGEVDQAIEVRPGNRNVVHHVLVFYRRPAATAATPCCARTRPISQLAPRDEGSRPPSKGRHRRG